jgi:nicotinic acid mononucleotide adenylyltransferase
MNQAEKEAKYRLGDLYNNKISANMDSYVAVENGKIIQHNLGKQWSHYLGKDLRYIISLGKKDILIPVGIHDRCSSEKGYLFSYARSNGDNRVGLLDDHWRSKNEIVNEDTIRLHRDHKFFDTYTKCLKEGTPMPHSYSNRFLKDNPEFQAIDKLDIDTVKKILIPKKPFKKKSPLLFWRGSPTGGMNAFQKRQGYQNKAVERKDIIQYFKKHPCKNIDILTKEESKTKFTLMEIQEEANVKHKYLIELQGNDFASNIYWIYKKDCIVFRPDFLKSYTAWDCHLKPWVHYVPFDHANYQDLVDKIAWCEKNTGKCEIIIKNANNLHSLMNNNEHKKKVYTIMLNKITKNLK